MTRRYILVIRMQEEGYPIHTLFDELCRSFPACLQPGTVYMTYPDAGNLLVRDAALLGAVKEALDTLGYEVLQEVPETGFPLPSVWGNYPLRSA